MKVAVLGGGGWGTALACLLGSRHAQVTLWVRNGATAREIAASRVNSNYLPGVTIPPAVTVTNDLAEAVAQAAVVLFVTPSQAIREMARQVAPLLAPRAVVVCAAKGLEVGTNLRLSQVLQEELPSYQDRLAVLSGPNHAEEVGRGFPAATVVAATSRSAAELVQGVLMTPQFRVYTNPDMIGVEMGGALKNIIALGAGITVGLGYGDNTIAALITRGLSEIARLGMAMGANPLTFAGLAGIGDLVATCTSPHSRNRRAGMAIAAGQSVAEIQAGTGMVVEGFMATKAACALQKEYHVTMPITEEVYHVLYAGESPRTAVLHLMTRNRTHEMEEVVLQNSQWRYD